MKQRIVEYHSPQWSELVEQGWITHTIETLPSGVQVAIMVYYPPRRRMC